LTSGHGCDSTETSVIRIFTRNGEAIATAARTESGPAGLHEPGSAPVTRGRPAWPGRLVPVVRRAAFLAAAFLPFAFLAAFALYPLLQQGYGSFYSWYQLRPATFIGAHNYTTLFADPVAAAAAVRTVFYLLIVVGCQVGLGLAAAWLTVRARRGRTVLMAVFLLPLAVPWPTAAGLFQGFTGYGGLLNQLNAVLPGAHAPVLWLDHPLAAQALIVVAGIWKGTPWCFLLLLGALAASPPEVFEAARLDGARGLAFWTRVLLPSIRPMLVFVIVLRIFTEAQTYTSIDLLTGGGPSFTTQLASSYGYELAFGYFQFGTASALATLLGAGLLVVAGAGVLAAAPRALTAPGRERARWRPLPGLLRLIPARRRPGSQAAGRRRRWLALTVLVVLALAPFAGALGAGLLGHAPGGGAGGGFGHGHRPGGGAGGGPGLGAAFGVQWDVVRTGLWNSGLVTAGTLALTLLLAVPAAYVLARTRFRLRGALFGFVLFTLAIPGVVLILPQVEEISWLGLANTRTGLVLLYTAASLPLAVFFLRPAFAAVPEPLAEGMRVDGAGGLTIVRRLILPLSARTMIAVSVLVVAWVWNELPLAVVLINSKSLLTLPVLIELGAGGSGSLGSSWISMLPPLLVFAVAQRSLRSGLTAGSLL
jgi:multiple sugar transport system permease protein